MSRFVGRLWREHRHVSIGTSWSARLLHDERFASVGCFLVDGIAVFKIADLATELAFSKLGLHAWDLYHLVRLASLFHVVNVLIRIRFHKADVFGFQCFPPIVCIRNVCSKIFGQWGRLDSMRHNIALRIILRGLFSGARIKPDKRGTRIEGEVTGRGWQKVEGDLDSIQI